MTSIWSQGGIESIIILSGIETLRKTRIRNRVNIDPIKAPGDRTHSMGEPSVIGTGQPWEQVINDGGLEVVQEKKGF